MKARDIMTTAVVSVPQDARVEDAITLMLSHHVSALPVIGDKGLLVGLISEGDLMRRLRDEAAPRRSWWLELFGGTTQSNEDFIKARSHRVTDVMTRDVVSVTEETPIGEIAGLLEKKRIKRVPVLRDGRVVGIVSRANLLQALARIDTATLPKPTSDDRALRVRIGEALTEVPGIAVNLVNYTVESGDVAVWGVADNDYVEKAVRVAVENVPGVRSVDVQMGRLPAWGYGI
ncbi:MAG: CBS domain-containing protein [Pseudorhodobacter sp.]|nr:CBS domain-containing protein [Pseudorhodobacter sp.]